MLKEILIPGDELNTGSKKRLNIVKTIPDPGFVGPNPPGLDVDEFGNVYKPVIGGKPALAGHIDSEGRFHPLIIGGLPSPSDLPNK